MLTNIDTDTCRELKNRISTLVNLIDYRAFGSRVRGDNEMDSDLDIFIEVETLTLEIKRKIQAMACELGIERKIYISPLLFSKKEIEETAMRSSGIVRGIKQDGVAL
jgi:predicted nucleotidyltransferase